MIRNLTCSIARFYKIFLSSQSLVEQFAQRSLPIRASNEEQSGNAFKTGACIFSYVANLWILLVIPVLFQCPGSAAAAYTPSNVLYVSPTGNDTNSGTITSPLATISSAANRATPGTDIIVRAGTYPVTSEYGLSITCSGTASAPIRFYNFPGEHVIITGVGVKLNDGAIVLSQTSFVSFSGFEIANSSGFGLIILNSTHDSVVGNTVHDSFNGGLYVLGTSPGISSHNLVQDNHVYNNCLNNSGTAKGSPSVIFGGGISSIISADDVVRHNESFDNYGEGITLYMSNASTVCYNIAYDNYSSNIYLNNAPSALCCNNLVYFTGNSNYLDPPSSNNRSPSGITMSLEYVPYYMLDNGLKVINNIAIDTCWGITWWNIGTGRGGLTNSLIANNTWCNLSSYAGATTYQTLSIQADTNEGNTYVNNLHVNLVTGSLAGGSPSGFTMGNNSWYGGSVSGFSSSSDVFANPNLNKPGPFLASDYALRHGSPCLGKGQAVSAVTVNFNGTPRTKPLDIGALFQ